MLFDFSITSIILFCLLMAGFITLWAASLLSNKRANKPVRLADDTSYGIKSTRTPNGVVLDKADTECVSLQLDSNKYVDGTYVSPTHMSRGARRAALSIARRNRRKASKVVTGAAVILLTLTASLAGSAVAWHYGGGQMYAEPCHSLLWCH